MSYPEYVENAANRLADIIIEKGDIAKKAILMYLSEKNVVPCFELDFFLKYVKGEREVHKDCISMEKIGLLEIHDARENILRTTVYRATPLGKLVGEKLEEHEIKNGYPNTKEILEITRKELIKEGSESADEKLENLLQDVLFFEKSAMSENFT